MVDLHNHLIPAVDDGAQSIDESCAALTALAGAGVHTIITTPHVNASVTLDAGRLAARLAEIDTGWAALLEHAGSHHAELTLARGVELALDASRPALNHPGLRLGGGMFLLAEFSFMTVPPRSDAALADLRSRECWPILAHPERYSGLGNDASLPERWRRAGAHLQVNGGSLLGKYGETARRRAVSLLEQGWVDYLGSDYHARGNLPIQACRALLLELKAEEQAQLLMDVNPARILRNELPEPVPPLAVKRSLWERVAVMFRAG